MHPIMTLPSSHPCPVAGAPDGSASAPLPRYPACHQPIDPGVVRTRRIRPRSSRRSPSARGPPRPGHHPAGDPPRERAGDRRARDGAPDSAPASSRAARGRSSLRSMSALYQDAGGMRPRRTPAGGRPFAMAEGFSGPTDAPPEPATPAVGKEEPPCARSAVDVQHGTRDELGARDARNNTASAISDGAPCVPRMVVMSVSCTKVHVSRRPTSIKPGETTLTWIRARRVPARGPC